MKNQENYTDNLYFTLDNTDKLIYYRNKFRITVLSGGKNVWKQNKDIH